MAARLVADTHSYRNRSQAKTIFHLGSTMVKITFTGGLLKLSHRFSNLLLFTITLDHTLFETCGTNEFLVSLISWLRTEALLDRETPVGQNTQMTSSIFYSESACVKGRPWCIKKGWQYFVIRLKFSGVSKDRLFGTGKSYLALI